MSVHIIIPTYGDLNRWGPIAASAVDSTAGQGEDAGVEVLVSRPHADTLADARNGAAIAGPEVEWLCFLDADDQLGPGYVKHMLAASGEIRRPATFGIYPDGSEDDHPVMIPRRNLRDSNFIVIGAFIRREQFLEVEGFRDLPALEDWDLFLRLVIAGANIVDVPEAVYRVSVRPDSRNQSKDAHNRTYNEIKKRYAGESLRQYGR